MASEGSASEWTRVQLGSVADITMGNSPPGTSYNEIGEGTPLLNGPTEFGPVHPTPALWTTDPRRFAEPGDILFCVRGSTTGRMNWANARYCIGRGIASIRGATPADTLLIRAILEVRLEGLLREATGSTFPNLSKQQIGGLEIDWPGEVERRRIAWVLGAFEKKLRINRRLCGTLEQMVATLFDARYVDYLREDQLQESEIGQVPRGWAISPLADLAEESRESVKGERGEPYIGLDAMPRGSTVLFDWATDDAPTGQARLFRAGDVLFGKLRPYFRKVGPAPIDGRASTEIVVLRPRKPYWAFFLSHIASETFIEHCVRISSGTRMPRAEWKDAGQFRVAVPPEDRLQAFNDFAEPSYRQIRELIHENRNIEAVRRKLLPRLIAGEVRVSEDTPSELIGTKASPEPLGEDPAESAVATPA